MDVESLNKKLDTYASKMIECYQEILFERKLLENYMQDGYLHMSKARSLMGTANLSQLQIPQDKMEAEIRVEYDQEDLDDHVKTFQFSLVDNVKKSTNSVPKWLGAFAPTSLNQSRTAFSRVINLVLSIAEKQNQFLELESAYKTLWKEKTLNK